MASPNANKKLNLVVEWCKGCSICIAFCPKQVLILNEQDKIEIKDESKCIKCGLCELRCPDYAIFLEGSNNE